MAKKSNAEVEPYQPNYSSSLEAKGDTRRGPGLFGCVQNSIAIIIISALVLTLLIGTIWILSIRETGNTANSIFTGLNQLIRGGPEVVEIDVTSYTLTLRQEAWLETVRQERLIRVRASDSLPGIIPGRRSVDYLAVVTITGGIDMEQLTEENFAVQGNTVTVTLPPPQLKDCILDETRSDYVDESNCDVVGVSMGCGGLRDLVKTQALVTAATDEETNASLVDLAYANAAEYVQQLGSNFGFQQVIIERSTEVVPPIAENGTCTVALPPTGDDVELEAQSTEAANDE